MSRIRAQKEKGRAFKTEYGNGALAKMHGTVKRELEVGSSC